LHIGHGGLPPVRFRTPQGAPCGQCVASVHRRRTRHSRHWCGSSHFRSLVFLPPVVMHPSSLTVHVALILTAGPSRSY
jgi:hypothetical protein